MGTVKKSKPLRPTKDNPFLGLTKKQKDFVYHYMKSRDPAEAIEYAFEPKNRRNATIMAYDYLNRDKIRKSIKYALKLYLNKEAAHLKLQEGLGATKHTRTEKGYEEVPDFKERRGFLDMYYKIVGEYAPEKKEVEEKRIMSKQEAKDELKKMQEYEDKEDE